MSEETPRLSRQEMRERGMLKAVTNEEGPSPVQRLVETSELSLKRPSRRELREQREANEKLEKKQSNKFASASAPAAAQPADSKTSAATPSTVSAPASQKAAHNPASKEAPKTKAAASQSKNTPAKTKNASAASQTEKTEVRRSVFNRMKTETPAPASMSLQDRLVARTKEARDDERPLVPAKTFSFPGEIDEETDVTFGEASSDDLALLAEAEKAEEEKLSAEKAQANNEKMPAVKATQPAPVVPQGEAKEENNSTKDTASPENKEKFEEKKVSQASKKETSRKEKKKANFADISVGQGNYPTDVSLRIGDLEDGEEEVRRSRLETMLIIAIGLLGGAILGLLLQYKLTRRADAPIESVIENVAVIVNTFVSLL